MAISTKKIVEVSREKEILDKQYPASVQMVNVFLKKYGVSTYEKTDYLVNNENCTCAQDVETKIKDLFHKKEVYDYQVEIKIFYRTILNVSRELAETLSTVRCIGSLKLSFYAGYNFFQRARKNPNIKIIQKYLEESDIGRGFFYEIYETSIGYFDHVGQEDENHISYSGLGLKDLQSDNERYGLGFAIAELFLAKQGLDIKTGILERKIEVSHLSIIGDYYAITFQINNRTERVVPELQDW